jgi:hypothetical protein
LRSSWEENSGERRRWKTLEDWKIKIAVLWLLYGMASFGYSMLGSAESGTIERIGPELLLLAAVIVVVQLAMVFLSLTLKDSPNRWVNIIVGGVFFVLELFPLGDAVAKLSASTTLIMIAKVVVIALIVWYAWKSKQKT